MAILASSKVLTPQIGAKIFLFAQSLSAQLRLNQYGSTWIIRRFGVYDPVRYLFSDPYKHLQGLITLSISPVIDLPQSRRIGFPHDSDFSWEYLQDTMRAL